MIKKILSTLFCISLLLSPVYSTPLIVDEFVEETLDNTNIQDYDNSRNIIQDEFVTKYVKGKCPKVLSLSVKENKVIDEIANNIDKKRIKQFKAKNKYNYSIPPVAIELKVLQNWTTKKENIHEGDLIPFKTIKPTKLGKYILPKDTEVIGRVEAISQNDLLGTPADLIIDNFFVKNNEKINFHGTIKKRGADRTWWLYPMYQVGNWGLYAAGYPLVLIRGGHAKLSTKEIYTVYYEQLSN